LASIRPLDQTLQFLFLRHKARCGDSQERGIAPAGKGRPLNARGAQWCMERMALQPAKVSGQGRKITKMHDDVTECSFVVQV